ncbi:hypothetical protein KI387_021982, partial [Taxus chinensis]
SWGICSLRALSERNDDPTRASRPWDEDRDWFFMGDGARILLLEELEHAKHPTPEEVPEYGEDEKKAHESVMEEIKEGNLIEKLHHTTNNSSSSSSSDEEGREKGEKKKKKKGGLKEKLGGGHKKEGEEHA